MKVEVDFYSVKNPPAGHQGQKTSIDGMRFEEMTAPEQADAVLKGGQFGDTLLNARNYEL